MKIILNIALMFLVAISTITAQSIRGKVSDENGRSIPGATVIIEGHNTGKITDERGVFRFMHLNAQEYTFTAKSIGYDTQQIKVDLKEGQDEFIEFKLVPNTELREIEVFGERHKQPEKLDAITRMPLRPSEQIQSISVISEKVIAEQGALTITDVVRNVPGVTLFGSYGGVRESLSTRGYRGVPILKNGVRVDSDFRTAALASDMQGVESIQVIKGSAAITQGVGNDLGSPGGVINVVTKTPKFINGGEAGVRGGSWGQARAFFDVQSVLDKNRTFAFRLNGAYERGDGFKRLTKKNSVYVNPSVEWRPDDKTVITAELDYLDSDKTPDIGTVNLANMGTDALYKDAREKYFGFDSDNVNNKTLTSAVRITRHLSESVYVRAAYFGSSYKTNSTTSGLTPLSLLGEDGKPILDDKKKPIPDYENSLRGRTSGNSTRDDQNKTFQLDLIGRDVYTGSIKHTFQVGFDYKSTELETISNNIRYNGNAAIDTINVFNSQANISNTVRDNTKITAGAPSLSSSSSYGIMIQDVTTFNDYLKLILGLRYSSGSSTDSKKVGTVKQSAWNPMAGIMVSPIKNINLFASFTTTSDLRSAANVTVDGGRMGTSTSRQWEFGVKSDWVDNRLRFNFTYFDILNSNLSNTYYEPGSTVASDFVFKAGDLKRRGIETELSGRILDNLQVMIGYAYLDAFYDNSPSYINGSAPMNAPKHTANAWAQYVFNKTILKNLSIGVGAYYVGDRPVNEFSNAYDGHGNKGGLKPFDMPSYLTINAQVGYTYGKVTARVFFNNIFDELGYSSYFRGGYINQIDPRNFATTVSYKF